MPPPSPSPSPAPWARSRLPALVGAGAFIILAGTILPKVLTDSVPAVAPAPAGSEPNPMPEFLPVAGGSLERLLIGASVALLAGVGGLWLYRRRKSAAAPAGLLNVTAALPLRHNCCAYLVEVGGRQFLAGVDPTGIRSILALPPGEEPAPTPAFKPPVLFGVPA